MTLVELMLGMLVLVVAIGATMGAIGSFVALEESNRETSLAHFAARRTLERMQDVPFADVFAAFNEDASDDPGIPNTGPAFPVDGLDSQADDADGLEGRVLFPIPAGGPLVLREDLVAPDFGLPMDLNGDGLQDAANHSGDYMVLPVRIRVEWRGASGNRFIELQTLLRGS
jgi:hypothetical protein